MGFARWLVLSALAVVAILVVGPHRGGPVGYPQVAVPSWAHVAPEQIAEARKHGIPVAFENGLGMRFVLIPAGTFSMGSPPGEEGRIDDETLHEVVLTRPYYVQVTEVTNGEFRRFRATHDSGAYQGQALNGDRQPVVMVSWTEAKGYAEWLTGQEGGRAYRLPTEAEWEWACRAGTRTRYWSGDTDADLARVGWYASNTGNAAMDVGTKPANPWGLFDMHGNVWEWCGDWYGEYPTGRAMDPSGPRDGTSRVLRGGSWGIVPRFVRSAYRGWPDPGVRTGGVGFRLVSPLPASR